MRLLTVKDKNNLKPEKAMLKLSKLFAQTKSAPKARKSALHVEGLEQRALCSANIVVKLDSAGVLRVTGTPASETIEVVQNDGYMSVWAWSDDIGDWDQIPIAGAGHGNLRVKDKAVSAVVVNGGDGD